MWSFIFYICCFALPIFGATPIVDLTYAQYQGVPTLDPVNNKSITHFFGIRYAAAPTGKGFPCFVVLFNIDYHSFTKTGSLRFREPQLPSHTPGVQLANKQPSQCFQAGFGTAPKTPFRNAVPNTGSTRRFEIRSDSSTEPESSEDCLFLEYIFMLIDMWDIMLTTTAVPVSTFQVAWEKRRTFRLFSIYMGIY